MSGSRSFHRPDKSAFGPDIRRNKCNFNFLKADHYLQEFQRLNVNRRNGEAAPHKAILLLSVIELAERGVIDIPFVALTDSLESAFRRNWQRYVSVCSSFICNLNYPFYHLCSSSFWNLVKLPTYEERKEYSMKTLKWSFAGAAIPIDLFELLQTQEFRDEARKVLIAAYLPPLSNHHTLSLSPLLIAAAASLFIA